MNKAVALAVVVLTSCSSEEVSTVIEATSCGATLPIAISVDGLAGGRFTVTLDGQRYVIRANGTRVLAVSHDGAPYALAVTTQPTTPPQTCTAVGGSGHVNGSAVTIPIHCALTTYSVGGTVTGLTGSGLVLHLDGAGDLAVAADGPFAFPTPLDDHSAYAVSVVAQPGHPSQTCVVTNGSGTLAGANVTDVAIACTTVAFPVTATITGLAGHGLVVRSNGIDVPIAANGPTALGVLDDGTPYDVAIAGQPTEPNQVCTIAHGTGVVDGAPVEIAIDCAAPGNLRITEVGTCGDGTASVAASCWLEVLNTSPSLAESLSLYRLRARSATRTFPFPSSDHTFPLPNVTIPPGGYAVIRGRSSDGEVSGGNVIYLFEANVLPSWNANGYAELVADGRTIDFVRWGGNPAVPTSGSFSGSAPNLPVTSNLGFVIARDLIATDTDTGADWRQRAFGTPGGPNDITDNTDADNDGIPDQAEVAGGTFAGLDLFAMGARTSQRDVFVQIDRMVSGDPGLTPQRDALDKVVAAFSARGIAIHFDAGALFAPSFDPDQYNLGGGNQVAFSNGIAMGPSTDPRVQNFYALKIASFDVRLQPIVHYMIFAWSQNAQGFAGSSGLGEINGNDTLVSLGGWGLRTSPASELNLLINYQAVTIMHELGHNLGLLHGGNVDQNFKPNYLSVMNYIYDLNGLPPIGAEDGARYFVDQRQRLGRASCPFPIGFPGDPHGPVAGFRIDYSDGTGGALGENAISDITGLRRPNSPSVDFDCNGALTSGYAFDLDGDGLRGTLNDFNDWANLRLPFLRVPLGNDTAPPGIAPTDPDGGVTGEVQPTAIEEPPPPDFFQHLHDDG